MNIQSSRLSSSMRTAGPCNRKHVNMNYISAQSRLSLVHLKHNRPLSRLNAISRKKQSKETQQEQSLQVPDVAPAKKSPTENREEQGPEEPIDDPVQSGVAATSSSSEERLSADEIRQQMAELRASNKEAQAKEGLVQGVQEEIQLIKWPTFQSALLNTFLVIAIVAGTSVVLFGVNTALAELSREIYRNL